MAAMNRRYLIALSTLFGLALLGVAGWVLHRELETMTWAQLRASLANVPYGRLAIALALTVLCYLISTGYDLLGIRYAGQKLPAHKIALASVLALTFSNNIGFAMVSATAVRMRLYTAWGLAASDVMLVTAFAGVSFWLGILSMLGLTCLFYAGPTHALIGLAQWQMNALGVLLLLLPALYILACARWRRPLKIRTWTFELPRVGIAVPQVVVSILDWILSAAVLFALMPEESCPPFTVFLGSYFLAQVLGLVSHVPGGIGVFEAGMVTLLKSYLPANTLLGVLAAYRVVYYFIPLVAGALVMGLYEVLSHRARFAKFAGAYREWIGPLVPYFLGLSTFAAGAVLLFSGSTPPAAGRMGLVTRFLPLPALELSHFLGSVAGALLLVLARGIQRRLNAAYGATVLLLGAGMLFSLLKGFDYEEALVLAVMLAVLIPCRDQFYRKTALLDERFSAGWIAAIASVAFASVWLGFFAFKHVEFSADLWWKFDPHDSAARALRATAAALSGLLVVALLRLFRPARPAPAAPSEKDLEDARAAARVHPHTYAWLALLGDKRFLFSEQRDAFIMFAVQGHSWVALGDPVGPEAARPDLLWRFRELAERHGGRTVFYEVAAANLSLYADMGLALWKLGEDARVPLEPFNLEGGAHKDARRELRQAEKAGCAFQLLTPEEVPPILPELKRISGEWLEKKAGAEKGFSLGFFDERYLSRLPVAIVRHEGKIVAFANVFLGGNREELSPDLMRYGETAPPGVMRYLFVNLMLYGKQEGYRWFSLGMAPLSGLESHPQASLWHKFGHQLFTHGEHFYNFQGLRAFKEKFDPVWTPKYLASPGGLKLPVVLAELVMLISKKRPSE